MAGRMEQPGGAGLTRDRRVSENRSQCHRDQTPNHKPLLSSHNGLCGDHMNVAAGNFCLPLFSSPGHGTSCHRETRTVAAGSSHRACPERWPPPDLPMASRAGCQCPSSPYRCGAVPGAFLQGHGTRQVGGRSRIPLPGRPLEAVLRGPSGTAGGLWPCRRPSLNTPILVLSPLGSARPGRAGQGGACT